MACFTTYMTRTNISIALIPMIKEEESANSTAIIHDVCHTTKIFK